MTRAQTKELMRAFTDDWNQDRDPKGALYINAGWSTGAIIVQDVSGPAAAWMAEIQLAYGEFVDFDELQVLLGADMWVPFAKEWAPGKLGPSGRVR
jgi:hypothetical protein